MKKTFLPLLFILAIPLVAFGVAKMIQWRYESNLQSALRIRYPELQAEQLKAISLSTLCAEPRNADMPGCNIYSSLKRTKSLAIAAAVLGLGLIAMIATAGRVSRMNRKLLVALFGPGLQLLLVAVPILIILHAIIAMSAVTLIGLRGFFILGIGVGALVGVVAMFRGLFNIVKKTSTVVRGQVVTKGTNPSLWRFTQELANKIGTLPPDQIVIGLEPNFFVTEIDVECLEGQLEGRTMYLSLPLCRILTIAEISAIIGHELGHFKGLDTNFSQDFYPIYKGTAESIAALSAVTGEDSLNSQGVALLPAPSIFSYFMESFALAESEISRERELSADQVGVQVAGEQNVASALLKLLGFSRYWDNVLYEMLGGMAQEQQFINLSSHFADLVNKNNEPVAFAGLEEEQLRHPTDSHPPLNLRLKALGLSVVDVATVAARTTPDRSAIELITDYESMEKELTQAEYRLMASKYKVPMVNQMDKKCPACSTSNPIASVTCQCGYNFLRQGVT